jgi:hypothetical protein
MLIRVHQSEPGHLQDRAVAKRVCELLGMTSDLGAPPWPLPNMKEVNETEFWWHQSSSMFKASVWGGQIKTADVNLSPKNMFGHPEWSNVFIYLSDAGHLAGGGYAVQFIYNNMDYNKGGAWHEDHPAVRYYTWQVCVHEFEETGPVHQRSRGWHEYTCKKCKATHSVDSGD